MEITFQRTRLLKRGPEAKNEDTDSSDSKISYAERKLMRQHIKNKDETGISTSAGPICNTGVSSTAACREMVAKKKETPRLVSFWDLVGLEGVDRPKMMQEREAQTEMVSPNTNENCDDKSVGLSIVEVDLTDDSPEENDHEVSVLTTRISHSSPKEDRNEADNKIPGLFDRTLLAELTTENTWMDRLRRVIERNDRHSFELMGRYTNPL